MKTAMMIYSIVLTAFMAIALTSNDDQSSEVTSEYIVVRYSPFPSSGRAHITIHYGGDKVEDIELTKEEENKSATNYAINLLTKFNKEGYELISTTAAGQAGQINCFLKKKR